LKPQIKHSLWLRLFLESDLDPHHFADTSYLSNFTINPV
jgi:hypothetical protein